MMSDKDWKEWDKLQVCLDAITRNSKYITEHAGRLERAIKSLPARPLGSERALADIRDAEERTAVANALLRAVREIYEQMSITLEPAE